jgi:hypothetical protein
VNINLCMKSFPIKKTYVFIFTAFFLGVLLVTGIYLHKSNFYKPVFVSLSGIRPDKSDSVSVIGAKPFGGLYNVERTDSFTWKGYDACYKDVSVQIPSSSIQELTKVVFRNGDEEFVFSGPDFLKKWEKSSINKSVIKFAVPEFVYAKNNLYEKIFWLLGRKIVLHFLLVISLTSILTLLFFFRHRIFVMYKRLIEVISKRVFYLITTKKRRYLISLILVLLYFTFYLLFFPPDKYANAEKYQDTWAYQSIAINYAKGYGMQKSGFIVTQDEYQFKNLQPDEIKKLELFNGTTDLHRPPVYPNLVGLIYKICGINLIYVKLLQLLLICFVCAFLPIVAYSIWQEKGYWYGMISGILFLFEGGIYYEVIQPISFTIFIVFICFVQAIKFYRKRSLMNAALLGFLVAFSWLINASLCFLPFLFVGDRFLQFVRSRKLTELYSMLVFAGIFVLTLLPWQLFLWGQISKFKSESTEAFNISLDSTLSYSAKLARANLFDYPLIKNLISSEKLTLQERRKLTDSIVPTVKLNGGIFDFSKIGNKKFFDYIILTDLINTSYMSPVIILKPNHEALSLHNEFVDSDGAIHQEWRYNKLSYYVRNSNNSPDILRILDFYENNPSKLISTLSRKIHNSFKRNLFVWAMSFLIILEFLFFNFKKISGKRILNTFKLIAGIISIGSSIIIGTWFPDALLLTPFVIISFFLFLFSKRFKSSFRNIPSLNLFLFNYLAIAVLLMANERYLSIPAYLFALYGLFYFISYFTFKKNYSEVNDK